jgi:hypothetical protein
VLDERELARWQQVFAARSERTIAWAATGAAELTERERRLLGRSIATFQLGESSEGRRLQGAADSFASRHALPAISAITRRFIREEQLHARLLGEFMAREGIPFLQREWSDSAFRALRRSFGFELSISILISAELIALTFYPACARAARSRALEELARFLVADEEIHIAYESWLIESTRSARGSVASRLAAAALGVLYGASVCVVWLGHRRVLRAGGFTFERFARSCARDFARVFAAARARRLAGLPAAAQT